jgi:lactate racemase
MSARSRRTDRRAVGRHAARGRRRAHQPRGDRPRRHADRRAVFPHEVVGFSGGNKYLFPGVAGREVIDVSIWLGALITSAQIIGTRGITPGRALINEAAALVPGERLALCVVTQSGTGELHSMAFGDPVAARSAAADVSAETHVRCSTRPCAACCRCCRRSTTTRGPAPRASTRSSRSSPTAARSCSTRHTSARSTTHPQIAEIGYHCRDYFVKQWDRFKDLHWGDLAHSTHLRGAGTWDKVEGERPRVTVTLATAIPRT